MSFTKKLTKAALAAAFMAVGSTPLAAQIVNIESSRLHTDSARVGGQANLSFHFSDNNNRRLLTTRSALVLQLKSKNYRDLWLLLANADLSRANGEAFSNSAFLHARYNRKLGGGRWRWEVFGQLQSNRLLGIQTRLLSGAGPRLKWLGRPWANAYAGALYMYEYEAAAVAPRPIERQHRLSAYLSATLNLPRWLPGLFITTTYYQPRLDKGADFRLSHESSLEFSITARVKAIARYTFLYDAFPPAGIRSRAQVVEQGLKVAF